MIRRNFLTSLMGSLAAWFARPAKASQFREVLGNPTPEPYQGTREIRHTDVRVMLDEIAAHTRRTGDVILRADDPRQRLIGFHALGMRGEGILWDIRLTDAKNSLDRWLATPVVGTPFDIDAQRAQLVQKYLLTPEGRDILCRAFPGQRRA